MSAGDEFARLVDVMHRLRDECPWDRSQTHRSLRTYLLEEAYEVLHALDEERYDELRDELGDLMLQVVFHAEIAEEDGRFAIEDVVRGINEKLIRRHPHVFDDKEAHSPEDVLHRWEKIKRAEGGRKSALEGVPTELPALGRAVRMLSKVRQTGVDPLGGVEPAAEAAAWLERLTCAADEADADEVYRAVGMLTLSAVALAGGTHVNPEDALREVLRRMADTFREEEARLAEGGGSFGDLGPEELARIGRRVLAACEEG